MERNSATSLSALPVSVLYLHNSIRKVTFIHVKIKAVHRYKLSEGYIISLFVWIS